MFNPSSNDIQSLMGLIHTGNQSTSLNGSRNTSTITSKLHNLNTFSDFKNYLNACRDLSSLQGSKITHLSNSAG